MSDKTQKIDQQLATEGRPSFDELPRRKRLLTPKQGQKTAYVMLGSSAVFIFLVIAVFLGFIIVNGFTNFSFR